MNEQAECINLATRRRDGSEVLTPVWYVWHEERLWLRTALQFGKVKRLRNDARLRFAPCDWNGNLLGDWQEGTAELFSAADSRTHAAEALLEQRYGERRAQMSAYLREQQLEPVFIAVTPETRAPRTPE